MALARKRIEKVAERRRRKGGMARVGGLARDGRKRSTRIPRQILNPGP